MMNDRTRYDIGEPFINIRIKGGYLAHTPNGIVLSLDTGTRYTCSYGKLANFLKASSVNQEQLERTNIYDEIDKFKDYCQKLMKKAETINNNLKND